MAKVKIFVSLKEGILDPQGKTVGHALKNLGFNNASEVRIGKYITLNVDKADDEEINDMCQKLLVNPIIEDYRYEIE